VGEYTAEHEISFTGTPPYNLVLVSAGSGTRTYSINDSYYILYEGETLQSFSDKTGAPGTKINECHAPGSTVTFTAFNPCSNAATYSVWYLEDTRESNNIKTYKVKKMADGHIWMAQDLAFGNLCPLNSVSANGVSSILGSSYGKCINLTNGSPSSVNGYFYDWSATMNGPDNQSGCSGTSSGTSDTNPGACQGICPVGWHIPTGNTTGELYALYNAMGNCASNCNLCWGPDSPYEGVARGRYGDLACGVRCWSSTPISSTRAYMMLCGCNSSSAGTFNEGHEYLTPVRCIRNY
jgi:uncharacterized protein (TIGR02145 family)